MNNLNTTAGDGPGTDTPTLQVGSINIVIDGYSASVGARHVSLTRNEYTLLFELMRQPSQVLSMDRLARLDGVWGEPPTNRAIRARIAAIRQKLGSAGAQIKNVRGIGYQIAEH